MAMTQRPINGMTDDEAVATQNAINAGVEAGILMERKNFRKRVLKAIDKWKSEGRDAHDLWAMDNFLTGAGAFLTDDQKE